MTLELPLTLQPEAMPVTEAECERLAMFGHVYDSDVLCIILSANGSCHYCRVGYAYVDVDGCIYEPSGPADPDAPMNLWGR